MRILTLEVWNFGSYPHLKFEFDGLGLALVYGPTGSGKSTLMDAAPWCLFGTTAKGGSVEEIRSWQAMEEPTTGTADVQTSSGLVVRITRRRGKASQNDLYYSTSTDSYSSEQRGKDLADTQRRLEALLACSVDTYLSGAYFHEFSPTSTFFKDRPKTQRALLEQVAPLDFAVNLAAKASEARKVAKKALDEAERQEDVLEARLEALRGSKHDTERRQAFWNIEHAKKVKDYTTKFNNFEQNKAAKVQKLTEQAEKWAADAKVEFEDLVFSLLQQEKDLVDPAVIEAEIKAFTEETRCPSCKALSPRASAEIARLCEKRAVNTHAHKKFEEGRERLRDMKACLNPYDREIASAKKELNGWESILETTKAEVNPFTAQLEGSEQQIKAAEGALEVRKKEVANAKTEVSRLSLVYDLSFELRGQLLAQSVQEIQDATNRYLHDYFDAEIKVGFAIEGSDSLEVSLQKSGYDCVYTQLSKGQRGLLKLCFGISVMKASANAAGAHFDTLFFDEALDGLDSALKVKAFRLFEELATEHSGVLVIDHAPELQELFSTKFRVLMTGDASEMERDSG